MTFRRSRNVKIVATLGPASSDIETIRALFEAGADVFRLNMSHGSHEDIRARHDMIRQIEAIVVARLPFWPIFKAPSCASAPLPRGRRT
jgi:pyruvate kinase